MQANEITIETAITQAPKHAEHLLTMAQQHRAGHKAINQCQIIRNWHPSAGTWCYQTHIAIADQPDYRLDWLTNIFFNAATLVRHPWYPQFGGGKRQSLSQPPARGIDQHQLCWGRFDLGLSSPRYYRQLVSLALPEKNTAAIVARSVNQGPPLPDKAVLAFTPAPNGEVFHYANGRLHWHHICCTSGPALLPPRMDRWLINCLRYVGLDQAERKTYRGEAEQLRDWLQGDDFEMLLPEALAQGSADT